MKKHNEITEFSQINIYVLLILFSMAIFFTSCTPENEKNEDLSLLKQEQEFIKKSEELTQNQYQDLIDNKFKLGEIDRELILRERKNVKTKADFIALFKKAGMVNAEEYYQRTEDRMRLAFEEMQQNPKMVEEMRATKRSKLLERSFGNPTVAKP